MERERILVGLGENYRIGWNKNKLRKNPQHLGTASKAVAIGCAIWYLKGKTDKIVFSSGPTSGEDIDSEATAMKKYVRRKFTEIPDNAIDTEDVSKDTSTNAEQIIKKGYSDFVLLAPKFHKRRAIGLFQAWGTNVRGFVASDDILRERSKRHARLVRKQHLSWQNVAENIKETILNIERLFDPKGLLLRKITAKRGK